MENMDKGLTVPKWVLIDQPEIPQLPQNLSAQAQKFWISMKKGFIGRAQSMLKNTKLVRLLPILAVPFKLEEQESPGEGQISPEEAMRR